MSLITILIIVACLAVLAGIVYLTFRQYKKVAPNEILVISGKKKYVVRRPDGSEKQIGYRCRVGGGAFVNPFTERAEVMKLEVITVGLRTPEVLTSTGVPIVAEAIAQVRIDTSEYPLTLAVEQFLGKGHEAIREVVEAILEGKMRAVIGSLTVEQISQERLMFSEKVQESAESGLSSMGLQLASYSLKDISDTQGYLDALGRPRIAEVKRDAAVAQAEADRDASIQSSQARKDAEIAKLSADAEVAAASWKNEALKADSQVEVNKRKAHADMSYELERHKISQDLKKEEYQVKKIEKEHSIQLEELEGQRKEKELYATVIKPAEARKQQIHSEAEAESFRLSTEARGRAEAKKIDAEADSTRVQLLGKAEALSLSEKAKAFGQYNEAAITQMVVDVLPELAKSVSEPLSNVDKIVMVGTDGTPGASKITGQVAEILAQLPEVVKSLTGVDISKMMKDKLNQEDE